MFEEEIGKPIKLTKVLEEFQKILPDHLVKLERLRAAALGIMSSTLRNHEIGYLPIQSRVKEQSSILTKAREKGYLNPKSEMTDLLGFRVIVYLSEDVEKVEKVLRKNFYIDETRSIDKRIPDSVDKVAYRSLHLICNLGSDRDHLPEYIELCDIFFEIQIRTILEHAWAEIEHKQNYKASENRSLPPDLQRRLMIVAGNLELLDRELSEISKGSAEYGKKIQEKDTEVGQDKLTFFSLLTMTNRVLKKHGLSLHDENSSSAAELISELESFGVVTNSDFKELIAEFPIDAFSKSEKLTTVGLVRDFMFFRDSEGYLDKSFHGQFYFDHATVRDLSKLTGKNFAELLKSRDIFCF